MPRPDAVSTRVRNAEARGFAAYDSGKSESDNPYRRQGVTAALHDAWKRGWTCALKADYAAWRAKPDAT
jgi:hypothetical protein